MCLMNDSGIQSTYIRLLPHLRLTRIYPSELSLRLGIQGRNIDFFPPVPALLIKGSLTFTSGGSWRMEEFLGIYFEAKLGLVVVLS